MSCKDKCRKSCCERGPRGPRGHDGERGPPGPSVPVTSSYGFDDAPAQNILNGSAIVLTGANSPVFNGGVVPTSTGFRLDEAGAYNIDFNIELAENFGYLFLGAQVSFSLRYTDNGGVIRYSRTISVPYRTEGQYVIGIFIFKDLIPFGTLSLVNTSYHISGGLTLPLPILIDRAQFRVNKIQSLLLTQ